MSRITLVFLATLLACARAAHAERLEDPDLQQLAAGHYANKFNVGIDEALRRIRLQDRASGIEDSLSEILGQRFAGTWYDHDDRGRLKIGMTRDGRAFEADVRRIIDQYALGDDVQLVDVRYTIAELEARRDAVRESITDMMRAGHARTGYDPQINSVVVTALARLPAAEEARIRQFEADGISVRRLDVQTLVMTPAYCTILFCDPPLRGGRWIGVALTIEPNFSTTIHCTGGFLARHRVHTSHRLLLTAGHCVYKASLGNAGHWQSPNGSGLWTAFGGSYGYVLGGGPGADAGAIFIDPDDNWYSPAPLAEVVMMSSTQSPYNAHYKIHNDSTSTKGQTLCISGMISQTQCAIVSDLGQDYAIDGGWTLKNAGELDRCAYPGDSGAPVYKNHKAFGLLSAAGPSSHGCVSVYQGIRGAENLMTVDVEFAPL